MSNQSRQPAGQPVGGQFAATTRAESAVPLNPAPAVAHHPVDDLIAEWYDLQQRITAHAAPELTVEEVTDDGETFAALRCPRCGGLVDSDSLTAVDISERWNRADDPDDDAFDHQRVSFSPGDDDYGETMFYQHDDGRGPHAVSLPDGWGERWDEYWR